METVKITNTQNIVEKSFTYQQLYDIFVGGFTVRKWTQLNPDMMNDNPCYIIKPPIVTVNGLPSDFESYKYIYINAPFLDFYNQTDTPFNFPLAFSKDKKTTDLFTGNGFSSLNSDGTPAAQNETEVFSMIHDVLAETVDIQTNKQTLIPQLISTAREIYIQIPTPLLIYALTNQLASISPTKIYDDNAKLIIQKSSYAQPFEFDGNAAFYNATSNGRELPKSNMVLQPLTSNKPRNDRPYGTQVIPYTGLSRAFGLDVNGIMTREKWKLLFNYINNPLNKKDSDGNTIDFSGLPNFNDWLGSIQPTRYTTNSVNWHGWQNIPILSNPSFMNKKLINIYFSKEPMGI